MRCLVILQLLALAVLGGITVARFHVWAPIDERAHYAYVQSIAEDARLPAIDDVVSWQVQAITDRTWPRRSGVDPATIGLAGRNYEAFQPPLYYAVAAPVFAAVPDHRHKVFALRLLDLLLLAVALAVLWRLARDELPEAPAAALGGGALVLLWPGVLVRGITASNLALEVLLASALLLALRRGRLLRAGVLLGACLLTKLTLVYLVVPFALVLVPRLRADRGRAVAAALLPAAVVSPWVVSNLVRFGHLTENAAARAQQAPVIRPGGAGFGLADLPGRVWNLTDGVVPQEWAAQLEVWWVRAVTLALLAALVVAALALARRGAPRTLGLAASAVAAALVVFAVALVHADWDVFLLRYLYAVLPALGVGVAAAAHRRLGARAVTLGLAVLSVGVALLWIDLAGAFYFTDVGDRLGI